MLVLDIGIVIPCIRFTLLWWTSSYNYLLEEVKKWQTWQRRRKHIPARWCPFSSFSWFDPPLSPCVKGPDASLCAGRWRDCLGSLMKGGCSELSRGYLGHWYALEASTGIVWPQWKGQSQRLGGGWPDRVPFRERGQSEPGQVEINKNKLKGHIFDFVS